MKKIDGTKNFNLGLGGYNFNMSKTCRDNQMFDNTPNSSNCTQNNQINLSNDNGYNFHFSDRVFMNFNMEEIRKFHEDILKLEGKFDNDKPYEPVCIAMKNADNLSNDDKKVIDYFNAVQSLLLHYNLTKEFVAKYFYLLNPFVLNFEIFDDELYYQLRESLEPSGRNNINMKAETLKRDIFAHNKISDDMIIKLISEGYLTDQIYSEIGYLSLNDNIVSKLIDSNIKSKDFLFRISLKNISLDIFKKYIDKDYIIKEINSVTLKTMSVEIFEYLLDLDKLSENIIDVFRRYNNLLDIDFEYLLKFKVETLEKFK